MTRSVGTPTNAPVMATSAVPNRFLRTAAKYFASKATAASFASSPECIVKAPSSSQRFVPARNDPKKSKYSRRPVTTT